MPVAALSDAHFTCNFKHKDDQWIRWLLKLDKGMVIDVNKYSATYNMKQWCAGTIEHIDYVEIAKDNSKYSLVNSEISGGMVPSYFKIKFTKDNEVQPYLFSCDGEDIAPQWSMYTADENTWRHNLKAGDLVDACDGAGSWR